MNTNKTLTALATLTAAVLSANVALADDAKTTAVRAERYHEAHVIERVRTGTKESAVFSAPSAALPEGADALLVARSVSGSNEVVRWTCTARADIAECLGTPVALKYRSGDDKITLSVVMVPERPDVMLASAE
ncbi:MAG: hypothetical protein RMA76_27520 [Deltaproteobacteria bacterium]|jgi:hypothetical protein